MKKSTLLMMLSLVLAVAMGIGGTLAYLTDTDGQVNVMTVGNVQIKQNEQDRTGAQFQQGQQMLPMVGDTTTKDANGYPAADNYMDKIVTVTNTGASDAYVRTLIAIPVFSYEGKPENNASFNVVHWNGYSTGDAAPNYPAATRLPGTTTDVDNHWHWGTWDENAWPGNGGNWNSYNVTIDGIDYLVYVVTHTAVVKPGDTTAPNMIGIYLDSQVDFDNDNGYYTYNGKKIDGMGTVINVPVLSQAVQAGGFENAWEAFDSAFETDEDAIEKWFASMLSSSDVPVDNAEANAAFKEALSADKETIVVNLTEDVTYDVAAWSNNGMGGASTETIVINGNGNTINFKNTNSDWNNIVTNNGAKLIITNAHITNSGYNDGPWNRHDLNFACEVELIDVTSDKAFAFKAGATLKNVTVSDANTSDTYAIWIQPNGQTVTLDGVTIDMLDCTDGRGIKIDEQYVSNPKKVTLNVSNTTFKTEEKSAILVKCAAGAEVNLNNVDITGVEADKTNPVWVDEASASYADLVVVNGGTKIVEP